MVVVVVRGRLGKSALTVVYIFAVLLAVRNFPGGPSAPTSCFLRGQSVQALRNFVASQPAEFRRHQLPPQLRRTRSKSHINSGVQHPMDSIDFPLSFGQQRMLRLRMVWLRSAVADVLERRCCLM